MKLSLPSDFARKIAETLGLTAQGVEGYFEVDEDKAGFFYAKLQPKKWLDTAQFKMLCSLVRDLNGEYVKEKRLWRVPGPYAKQQAPESSQPKADTASTPALPGTSKPSGVRSVPDVLKYDKSKPPELGPLPETSKPSDARSKIPYTVVPLKALLSMPFQSRKDAEDPDMPELVESIKAVGVLEPLLVRPKADEFYEIVAGERRKRAAEKAGLTEVPVIIKQLSDQEAYEIQLSENIQRRDLSDMEKARMLDYMIKTFGYLQKDLAKKLSKSEAWVSQHLAMLDLEKLHPGEVDIGKITEKQAREILSAPEEKREEILDKINESGVVPSARELHQIAYELHEPEEAKESTIVGQPKEEPKAPEPEPLLTGFEWTCPECGKKFIINHVDYPGGDLKDHYLEACGNES